MQNKSYTYFKIVPQSNLQYLNLIKVNNFNVDRSNAQI